MAQVVVWEVHWLEVLGGGPVGEPDGAQWRWRAFVGTAASAEALAREFVREDLQRDQRVVPTQIQQRPPRVHERARLAGGC